MLLLSNFLTLLLAAHAASELVTGRINKEQRQCTVIPLGAPQNDVPQIRKAFEECNNGGKVIFPPGQTYRIAERVKVNITNIKIDWSGIWLVCYFEQTCKI